MKETAVTVTIRSRHALNGETAQVVQEASGTLSAAETGWTLCYREPAEPGETPVENTLLLECDRAELTRSGGIRSRMVFRPGETRTAPYRMPCGALELSVTTDYLGHTLTADGGKVMIRYAISAQGSPMGDYTLKLHIRKKDDTI